MNTQQLIESTMLHTLGLLEDHEIVAFEAAFESAPASVQLMVREEALRMSDFGDLMPNNEPDPALRELVISAVRAAMREQENDQRIASGSVAAPTVATRAIAGRIDAQIAAQSSRRAQPKISTTPRVHRLWRASTIGFAAATIALSIVWTNNNQTYNQMSPDVFLSQMYNSIGAEFLESTLFDSSTERVSMVSSNGATASMASVWYNPDWDSARLFVKNMKASQENPYRLVVLDDEGNIVREVATFSSEGELEDFDVQVNLKSDRRLAIYQGITDAIEDAEPLMTSVDSDL